MVVQIAKFDAAVGLLNLWQEATGLPLGSLRRRWAGEKQAHVAQLVERVLGKDEVTGSIPVPGSRICRAFREARRGKRELWLRAGVTQR